MLQECLDSPCIEASGVVDGLVFNHLGKYGLASTNEGDLLQCLWNPFTSLSNASTPEEMKLVF